MPDFALVGKKGTGKTKHAVLIAVDEYFANGLRVATNVDLFLKELFGPYSRRTYVRIPDHPTAFDLEAAGLGDGGAKVFDEDNHGMLLLDELGISLNARNFGDKARLGMLEFLALGRKWRWNTYYLMQNVNQVDKQLRESFVEYTWRHTRMDRVRVPFVGGLLALLFGKRAGFLPKFHVGVARLGVDPNGIVCDRASFTGKRIEAGYNTHQLFRADYPHGTHSVLSPWHVEGRFLRPERGGWWLTLALALIGRQKPVSRASPPVPLRPKSPALARVQMLCAQLPPDEGMRLMRRYLAAADRTPA